MLRGFRRRCLEVFGLRETIVLPRKTKITFNRLCHCLLPDTMVRFSEVTHEFRVLPTHRFIRVNRNLFGFSSVQRSPVHLFPQSEVLGARPPSQVPSAPKECLNEEKEADLSHHERDRQIRRKAAARRLSKLHERQVDKRANAQFEVDLIEEPHTEVENPRLMSVQQKDASCWIPCLHIPVFNCRENPNNEDSCPEVEQNAHIWHQEMAFVAKEPEQCVVGLSAVFKVSPPS